MRCLTNEIAELGGQFSVYCDNLNFMIKINTLFMDGYNLIFPDNTKKMFIFRDACASIKGF